MLLFLKIVAAVVLVLLVAAVLAWVLFKRWLGRKFRDYAACAEIVGDRYATPARIQLQLTESEPLEGPMESLWEDAHRLGFRTLADFTSRDGEPERIRAAVHGDSSIALAIEQQDDAAHFSLFALADDQRLRVISDAGGASLQLGTLEWQSVSDMPFADAFDRLQAETADRHLQAIDLRLFRDIVERSHARRQDAVLQRPPSREEIAGLAATSGSAATPDQIDRALGIARDQWSARVQEAVLDHYRRTSRIDAATWERQSGDLHVVHGHLSDEEIRLLLIEGDADQALWQQLVAQGLHGVALYDALASRLPRSRQRQKLAEIRTPLLARIYGRSDEPSAAVPARPHVYEAADAAGNPVRGVMMARSSSDALQQIGALGLSAGQVTSEPGAHDPMPDWVLDEKLAAYAARGMREGLGMALLRALHGNLWIWGPPMLWSAWSVYSGPPYGWGDYLGFAYLLLALLVLVLFVAPMVLYNQLQQCRVHGRWRSARVCLALLSRLNLHGALKPHQLLLERAKIAAGEGDVDAALALWASQSARLDESQYQAGLVQLHDAAGDAAATIAAQRAVLAHERTDLAVIDLGLSLAKHGDIDEAEAVLADLQSTGLSELAAAGYQYARGLLALRHGRHALALQHFSQAIERAAPFKSTPLILGMLAEINGYSALCLKRGGNREQADALWQRVRPLLGKHASCARLMREYESQVDQAPGQRLV